MDLYVSGKTFGNKSTDMIDFIEVVTETGKEICMDWDNSDQGSSVGNFTGSYTDVNFNKSPAEGDLFFIGNSFRIAGIQFYNAFSDTEDCGKAFGVKIDTIIFKQGITRKEFVLDVNGSFVVKSERKIIPNNGCAAFISKRGTQYKIFNYGHEMTVERCFSKPAPGGNRLVYRLVKPTKEILEKFEVE